jgi:hypothetical protein
MEEKKRKDTESGAKLRIEADFIVRSAFSSYIRIKPSSHIYKERR